MFNRPDSLHSLGIDIDGATLRAVEIEVVKGEAHLCETHELHYEPPAHLELVKPLYIQTGGEALAKKTKETLVVSALPSSEVIIRPLDLKLTKKKEIDAVLPFQCEPLLPYPIENALIDKVVLSQDEAGSKLTILATKKDYVQKHLQTWNLLEVNPEVVSALAAALTSFSKLFFASEEPHLILHIGACETTCLLVKNDLLFAAQSIPLGKEDLERATLFSEDEPSLEAIDLSVVDKEKQPALEEALKGLRLEISKTCYALLKNSRLQNVSQLLFVGVGANLKKLDQLLSGDLKLQFISLKPNQHFALTRKELERFAVPIGAALSTLPKETPINFRQQEFAYPNPWKRLKQPLMTYYLLCFACAFSIYLFAHNYVEGEKQEVRQEYVDLLTFMKRPYIDFEKGYQSKYPDSSIEGEFQVPEMLTMEQIRGRLATLYSEMEKSPDLFPLQPNIPKVSDFLAWLSANPLVQGEGKKGDKRPIQIDALSYSLVKRPELKKKQEKYQVKVELEFTTATPKIAREFHDSLIAPNDFIDLKGEVKWSSNHEKYRASFFLKDKTVYPNLRVDGGL